VLAIAFACAAAGCSSAQKEGEGTVAQTSEALAREDAGRGACKTYGAIPTWDSTGQPQAIKDFYSVMNATGNKCSNGSNAAIAVFPENSPNMFWFMTLCPDNQSIENAVTTPEFTAPPVAVQKRSSMPGPGCRPMPAPAGYTYLWFDPNCSTCLQ
jgi:hypothetical protein